MSGGGSHPNGYTGRGVPDLGIRRRTVAMAKFGSKKKKKKSWRRLSFSHKQTRASVLAECQSTSRPISGMESEPV